MRQRECKTPNKLAGGYNRAGIRAEWKKGGIYIVHRGEETKLTIKSYPIFTVLAQQEHIQVTVMILVQ